jgi:class 3 adenylate cyclase
VSDQLDRRLVAVMFTDMVGYTALMQADERLGVDKRDRYMRVLERHHDAFGGTIIQRLGDGSMSMFPSSLAAVLAAIAIQRELAAQDIPTRIGVHVGEVIVEPERLTGDAVNIAARIETFAVPGGVMLSAGLSARYEGTAARVAASVNDLASTVTESGRVVPVVPNVVACVPVEISGRVLSASRVDGHPLSRAEAKRWE